MKRNAYRKLSVCLVFVAVFTLTASVSYALAAKKGKKETREYVVKKGDRMCKQLRIDQRKIPPPPDDTSLAKLSAFYGEVISVSTPYFEKLGKLEQTVGSASQKKLLKKWQDGVDKVMPAIVAAKQAADDDNRALFESRLGQLVDRDVTTRGVAKRYGFKACSIGLMP